MAFILYCAKHRLRQPEIFEVHFWDVPGRRGFGIPVCHESGTLRNRLGSEQNAGVNLAFPKALFALGKGTSIDTAGREVQIRVLSSWRGRYTLGMPQEAFSLPIRLLITSMLFIALVPCVFADEELFRKWDTDGDGRVVKAEIPRELRVNFPRVDADGDGVITLQEHLHFMNPRPRPRPEPFRLPGTIDARPDLSYAGNEHPRQRVDVLLPRTRSVETLPVVLYIHGGGWQGGDRKGGWRHLVPLVQSGRYAGVSVGYRLTDEATWPAQIHDCKAAVRWVRANADRYGLDADRIVAWGHSAGGHLSSMLGVSGDVDELEGALGGNRDEASHVSAVIDFFGPTELAAMQGQTRPDDPINHDLPNSAESRLLGGTVLEHPELAASASPLNWVSRDDPPFLIVHGEADPLVPCLQSVDFHRSLLDNGVDSILLRINGGGHGGFRNPQIGKVIGRFLDRHVWNQEVEITDQVIPNDPAVRTGT